jgi:hypothetical protein
MDNGFCFYSGTDKIAEFNPIAIERANSRLGCVDTLAAQHFTVYSIESTEKKKTITFEFSNARFLKEGKIIRISVLIDDLGELLDCQMRR